MILLLHCPKNYLNLRLKTMPVTFEADATVYSTVCMFFVPDICFFQRRCNVVSAPVMTVSVTCLNSGYCWDSVTTVLLGQCGHRILNVFLFVIPIVYFIINTSFNFFYVLQTIQPSFSSS